jgi:two-component system NtrC family sensor kinase
MFFNRIGNKLIFSVALVLFFGIAIFAVIIITSQRSYMTDRVVFEADKLSETIRSATRYDMLKVQRESVHKIMGAIGQQKGINKVRIFNKEGVIMFSSDENDMGKFVDKQAEACFVCHSAEKPLERLSIPQRSRIFRAKDGTRVLGMVMPIYNEKDCYNATCHAHPASQKVLGVLDITIPLASIDKEISSNTAKMILFAILIILGISMTLSILVKSFVSKPVNKLAEGTKKVAAGNLQHRIIANRNDEVGELADSFNLMTENLSKANNEIMQWTKTLEQRVGERTEELKKAQSQLVQSEKMASLGMMAAGIAHEINNPLTTILINSHLLLEDSDYSNSGREELQLIADEATRCGKIVKGLLDFARQTRAEKRLADINLVLKQTLAIIESQASFHNITINKNLDDNIPKIWVDINQIKQVFMNIILNAAEAMPEGGSLNISTSLTAHNGTVNIGFVDSGCGISKENIGKLFDPFFSTKQSKGTGLGLALSYGIVKKHNGSIEVDSEIGVGSSFIVKLPLKTTENGN